MEIYQAVTALSKKNSYFRVTLKNISSKCIIIIAGTTSDQEKGSFYNVFLSSYRELSTSKKRLNFLSYSLKTVLCSHHCSKQRRYKSEFPPKKTKTKVSSLLIHSLMNMHIKDSTRHYGNNKNSRMKVWRNACFFIHKTEKIKNVYPLYTVTKEYTKQPAMQGNC